METLSGPISRRTFLRATAATAAGIALWPSLARADVLAAPILVDPYAGSIPLASPLLQVGIYTLQNSWHDNREGRLYQWSHRNSETQRAHDGVDYIPPSSLGFADLPTVYAPLTATVAAVCLYSSNRRNAKVTYKVSKTNPPPWNYSRAVDNVQNTPLYGNFVWLYSTDAGSAGYFVFFCHLKNESILRSLVPDQAVTASTAVGVMGDTGNAQRAPQLHAEIHYPAGSSFSCAHCSPSKVVTAIDPYISFAGASVR